ncbi:NAD binding dehydrogenase [Kwoniella mangroviensis CBS 10435]|uniref:NAD binding dehydrogenase n=1 Tax=Kwoniella mangroviensis CBS 10435 TaxID=1331196 RepID=A0A1B9IV04_9TREE|nr:NAD binding dehydrogenase [Kwoniella mangroviensis CBS 10435]
MSALGRSPAKMRLSTAINGPGYDDEIPKARVQPEAGPDVKVLVIGAGNINFGSDEGPWNHSQRVEQKLGNRLKIVGLVDPATARAQAVLDAKRLTFASPAYADTPIYHSVQEAISRLSASPPDLVLLGSPPAFRGTTDPSKGFNTEIQLAEGFPKAALFVEKPVSTGSVEEASKVAQYLEGKPNLVSVGYMLRYSAAVQKMKQILKQNKLAVMMTSARYVMAYEHSVKVAWWTKSVDCGPIVEQATHFCDLSRYFAGEVDLSTVMAHSVEWYEKPGQLTKIPFDENNLVPEDDRIPRFTSATWKYKSGAIGHLEHGVALQGAEFSTEITVFADGYQLKLIAPYNRPTLYVRRPGSDVEEVHHFNDDDPFLSEMSTFIDTAAKGTSDIPVLSSFADAVRTYELTWAIRWASEKTRTPKKML